MSASNMEATETKTPISKGMTFDEVLEFIGGFGVFQKIVFVLTLGPYLLSSFFTLNPVFLLGQPKHRCAIPGFTNDTFDVQDEFHECLINLTIPRDGDYDKCKLYVVEDPVNICNQNVDRSQIDYNTTIRCSSWVYERTVFTQTFVSELDLVCDKEIWVANAEMLLYAGMLVGSLVSGILADMYGRKPVLYVSLLAMTGSSIGLAFAKHYSTFVIAQFILGGSSVATFMPAYLISLEMTSAEKRIWPAVIAEFPHAFGLIVYALVAYGLRDWKNIQLVTSLPGILFLSYWWLMPESPRWLLTKGRNQEAELIIRKAAKWNKTPLPKDFSMEATVEEVGKDSASFLRVFTSRILCFRSSIIFFNWTVVAFAYYGLFLNTKNLAGDIYLNFGLGGLVEIPAYFIVIFLVDRVGRRNLYCASMLIGGVSCVSTVLAIEYGGEEGANALMVTLAMFGRLMITSGYCVQYIQAAELFPTVVRNAGLGGASLFSRVGTMIAPYFVILGEGMGGSMGETFPLIVFGVMSFTSGVVSLVLPETLNKTLPDTIADGERFGKSGAIHSANYLKPYADDDGTDTETVVMIGAERKPKSKPS